MLVLNFQSVFLCARFVLCCTRPAVLLTLSQLMRKPENVTFKSRIAICWLCVLSSTAVQTC